MYQCTVKQVCEDVKIKGNTTFTSSEIELFIRMYENILGLSPEEQKQELYKKWSSNTFHKLLEILCFLGMAEEAISIHALTEHPKVSSVMNIVRDDIFCNNGFEEIFYKFIQRKAVTNKDIDYGHSELEISRYADLSMEGRDSYEKLKILAESEKMFNLGDKQAPEKLRRERKFFHDLQFTCLIKHPSMMNDPAFQTSMFKTMDIALKNERTQNIDMQYGSHHHVLYGMINGNDDYVVEPWLNPHSQFQYVCFVVPLFKLLVLNRR